MNYTMIMFRPSMELSPKDLEFEIYTDLMTPDKIVHQGVIDYYTNTIPEDYIYFRSVVLDLEQWERMECWFILKTFLQDGSVVCDRKDNFINQLSLLGMAKLIKAISSEFVEKNHSYTLESEEFECLRLIVLFLADSILDRHRVTLMGGDKLPIFELCGTPMQTFNHEILELEENGWRKQVKAKQPESSLSRLLALQE